MPINFSNDLPIFLQLAEKIKSMIISGKLKANQKLPTVREFALTYAINPNTVQKALQILEDEGLIITDSTNGKFVAENPVLIEAQKNKIIKEEVSAFFEKMKTYGLETEEIKKIINRYGE